MYMHHKKPIRHDITFSHDSNQNVPVSEMKKPSSYHAGNHRPHCWVFVECSLSNVRQNTVNIFTIPTLNYDTKRLKKNRVTFH